MLAGCGPSRNVGQVRDQVLLRKDTTLVQPSNSDIDDFLIPKGTRALVIGVGQKNPDTRFLFILSGEHAGKGGSVDYSALSATEPQGQKEAEQLIGCIANLQTIHHAVNDYEIDQGMGSYSKRVSDLRVLVPKYLKALPTCPAAGESFYTMSEEKRIVCGGHHHSAQGLAENYPQYDSSFKLHTRDGDGNGYWWMLGSPSLK